MSIGISVLIGVFGVFGVANAAPAYKRFNELTRLLEEDARALAGAVEELYQNRCSETLFSECAGQNYNGCLSSFEEKTCPVGTNYELPGTCDEFVCSGYYSFAHSTVRVPPGKTTGLAEMSPTDASAIEAICFSRELDDWFVKNRKQERDKWGSVGVEPRSLYFGSTSGAFRIYPGRQGRFCGDYDPRERPWYVAASSGQKNVVLLIDTSGSTRNRFSVAKRTAKKIINSLSARDKISVLSFNENTTNLVDTNGRVLVSATNKTRVALAGAINELSPDGKTNFRKAFEQAFAMIENSIEAEVISPCNTAVILLTDGASDDDDDFGGSSEEELIQFVKNKADKVSRATNHPLFLFTYSMSNRSPNFASRLACSHEYGVWSTVDHKDNIEKSLAPYHLLFALGQAGRDPFTVWSEPYYFYSGGAIGATVSVPVFDRKQDPHVFLGVVGIDVLVSTVSAALGDVSDDQIIAFFNEELTSSCPATNLTMCQVEEFRGIGAHGQDARCHTEECPPGEVQLTQKSCDGLDNSYVKDRLWRNTQLQGVDYRSRACCNDGDIDQCLDTNLTMYILCGLGFVCLFATIGSYFAYLHINKKKKREGKTLEDAEAIFTTVMSNTGEVDVGELEVTDDSSELQKNDWCGEYVFISHRGPETKDGIAKPTHWFLREFLGIDCFLDEISLQPSDELGLTLFQAAHACTHALVIISPGYRKSTYCVRELNTFSQRMKSKESNITVIPALWGVENLDGYNDYFRKIVWLRHPTGLKKFDEYLLDTLWPELVKKLDHKKGTFTRQKLKEILVRYVAVSNLEDNVPEELKLFAQQNSSWRQIFLKMIQ